MGHTIQLILDVIFLLSLILFDLLYMLFPPYKLSRGSVFLLPVAFYVSALVVADRVDSYCFRSRTPSCTEHGKRAKKRQLQDSNLRGQSPTDFQSVSLTTRTSCLELFSLHLYLIVTTNNSILHPKALVQYFYDTLGHRFCSFYDMNDGYAS